MRPLVSLNSVSKRYRRYGRTSLRESLSRIGGRILSPRHSAGRKGDWMWAVQDLSFNVTRGQTLGIIGPNGAGKTTTLKLLSRITTPTEGFLSACGRVSALIELGAGFHPELTGRENVLLNGTILGMKRAEIRERFDDIIAFSALENFIDTPVKYYSSGMYARLGFAVAAHTNPDVLLVDEVLAVGDFAFQQKCYSRMQELKSEGTTIILVSHNLKAISEVCEQTLVMNAGKSLFKGTTREALAEYADLIRSKSISKDRLPVGYDGIGNRAMTHAAKITGVELVDNAFRPIKCAESGEKVRLVATIEFDENVAGPHFSCFVRDEQGRLVYDQTTEWQGIDTPSFRKGQTAAVAFELEMNLVAGIYQIGIDLHYADLSCYLDRLETAAALMLVSGNGAKGTADLKCRFLLDHSSPRISSQNRSHNDRAPEEIYSD